MSGRDNNYRENPELQAALARIAARKRAKAGSSAAPTPPIAPIPAPTTASTARSSSAIVPAGGGAVGAGATAAASPWGRRARITLAIAGVVATTSWLLGHLGGANCSFPHPYFEGGWQTASCYPMLAEHTAAFSYFFYAMLVPIVAASSHLLRKTSIRGFASYSFMLPTVLYGVFAALNFMNPIAYGAMFACANWFCIITSAVSISKNYGKTLLKYGRNTLPAIPNMARNAFSAVKARVPAAKNIGVVNGVQCALAIVIAGLYVYQNGISLEVSRSFAGTIGSFFTKEKLAIYSIVYTLIQNASSLKNFLPSLPALHMPSLPIEKLSSFFMETISLWGPRLSTIPTLFSETYIKKGGIPKLLMGVASSAGMNYVMNSFVLPTSFAAPWFGWMYFFMTAVIKPLLETMSKDLANTADSIKGQLEDQATQNLVENTSNFLKEVPKALNLLFLAAVVFPVISGRVPVEAKIIMQLVQPMLMSRFMPQLPTNTQGAQPGGPRHTS